MCDGAFDLVEKMEDLHTLFNARSAPDYFQLYLFGRVRIDCGRVN